MSLLKLYGAKGRFEGLVWAMRGSVSRWDGAMRRVAAALRLFDGFWVKAGGVWPQGLGMGAAAAAARQTGPREVATAPCRARDELLAGRKKLQGKGEVSPCVNSLHYLHKQHRGENPAVLHPSVLESEIRRN